VIILAVNDGAVMMNWAKSQKVGLSMLSFLGDPNSEFTKALVSNILSLLLRVVVFDWIQLNIVKHCSLFRISN
jgi:hypothetical protein